jgi:cysteine desulfurase/selenocysteine lyase
MNTFGLDIEKIRSNFPMLSQKVNGKKLIYLDSAASSHKPQVVIDRLTKFYTEEYAKPKEADSFSKSASEALEETRSKMAKLIGAAKPEEIIFTKGCTEGINIVAHGFARTMLQKGDEILITAFEHHANIVPWQMACDLTGAVLKVVPIEKSGEFDFEKYQNMITDKTKIISFSHSSHVLGTMLPVKHISEIAHNRGVAVMIDGAQAAPHMPVDMQDYGCDFYAFSGHKMGSPSGVGVLYGKEKWLKKIAPLLGGGEMASEVTWEKSKYETLPLKFEGGTTPFAEIIATGTLIDYVQELDMSKTSEYEQQLLKYATEKLSQIDRLIIAGTAHEKEPVLSFQLQNMDVKKLETFLNDEYGMAVRAGQLTAQPLMKFLGIDKLLRISFCYYNTYREIDVVEEAIKDFIKRNG